MFAKMGLEKDLARWMLVSQSRSALASIDYKERLIETRLNDMR